MVKLYNKKIKTRFLILFKRILGFHLMKAREGCKKSLGELERVSSGGKFNTVDAYFNDEEKKRMDMWNLTALTYMHTDEWKEFFEEAGYTGDYHWFIP